MRIKANNKFEKDFYKLMNNAVYGRFLMNQRKRINMELVTDKSSFWKLVRKNNFKDRIIYNSNVMAVLYHKTKIVLNSPIYVGFSVLELSKTLMYNFYYNVMFPMYGDRMKCCYMDTDSFIFHLFTDDLYKDLMVLRDHFDLSNYPCDHPCHSVHNKGILGKFKDETESNPVTEYVGLRPKLYSYKVLGHGEVMKCKGVKTTSVKKYLTFTDYLNTLHSSNNLYCKFKNIQSKKHCLHTYEINKLALSNLDDKRVVDCNNVDTLPYGHYSLI
jgi:hypothetical protein